MTLPGEIPDEAWSPVLYYESPDGEPGDGASVAADTTTTVPGHTFLVFRSV